jgi:hypothetical protein
VIFHIENPPRTGEGDREAVEGAQGPANLRSDIWAPSVSAAHCHLPVPGRNSNLQIPKEKR